VVVVDAEAEVVEGRTPPTSPELVRRYGLAAVVAVGLLARLFYWIRLSPDYVPERDAVHYHEIATRVADGLGLTHQFPQIYMHPTAFRPPLYPYLLGGSYKLFGTDVVTGRVLSLLLGLGAVALAYVLVHRIAGWRAAVVTGLLVAVYPPLVANDTFLLTEPLSLVLLLSMLYLLDLRRWAWAGVACGMLVLSRPSAQFVVVVVAVWVLWQLGWKRALSFTAITALVVAPWVVRNWVELGSPVLVTSNGFNAAASYSPQARETGSFVDAVFDERFAEYRLSQFNEVKWNDELQRLAIDTIRDDPGMVPDVVLRNFQQYFELDPDLNLDAERSDGRNMGFRAATLWAFYVVTAVGLFGLVVRARDPLVLLVLVIAGYFTLSSMVFVAPPRVRAPFDLCCCIGVGLAVDWLWPRVRARRTRSEPTSDRLTVSTSATTPVGAEPQGV
jgi:4-amino-4-deoxy-L-arabinose transferase-like glycosyltransferase